MAEKGAKQFGVFQKPTGSYNYGELHFTPLKAVEAPAEVAQDIDAETSNVKFFASQDKAAAEVVRLREKFEAKPKK